MNIQATPTGIQRELPKPVQHRGISNAKDSQASNNSLGLTGVDFAPRAGTQAPEVYTLAPYVPSGLRADSFELSDEAQQRLSEDFQNRELSKEIAEQFSTLVDPDEHKVGFDFSPEATAKRIARFATGIFQIWREQQPESGTLEGRERFGESLKRGIERGFGELTDQLQQAGADADDLQAVRESAALVRAQFKQVYRDFRAQG